MTDDEALNAISDILTAPFGSGQADLHRIAEIVEGTGRPIGKRFTDLFIRFT